MDDQQLRIIGVVVFWLGIVPAISWLKKRYLPKGFFYSVGLLVGRTCKRSKVSSR